MTFTTLRALHATVGRAIDSLEETYRKRSPSEVLDFPQLDVPYYSKDTHSPAEELAEQLTSDAESSLFISRIVAACGQLSAAVNRPWYGLLEAVQAGQLAACIRFLEASHVVEILHDAGPKGMHVKEICRRVIAARPNHASPDPDVLNADRLSHILRLLASSHWLLEVSPDVFANNRRSSFIHSGKAVEFLRATPEKKYVDTDGAAAMVGLVGDDIFKIIAYLTEWLLPDTRLGDLAIGASQGSDKQSSAQVSQDKPTSFNIAFREKRHYFDWLELPENITRLDRFGHAMTFTTQFETEGEVLQGFPWEEVPSGGVLVDVGGGIGSTSLTVVQGYPHIQAVVEDRAQVVEVAATSWGSKITSLVDAGRISWRARSMHTPWQPLASGKVPDVFLVRLVLHAWADEKASSVLRTLRSAAGPNTKLLIGDMLLPYACEGDTAFVKGSEPPLLANMGIANIQGYLIDIMMMGMFAAKERTASEMAALALSAGWKVTNVRRSPGSLWAYTTAVPV